MFAQIDGSVSSRSEISAVQEPFVMFWWFTLTANVLVWGYVFFLVWMSVECLRRDPERWWVIIILLLQPFGVFIYFFARWLPAIQAGPPRFLQNLTRGNEIRQLETAVRQIGNACQYIELADVLREVGQDKQSGEAYATALEKEPDNLKALWGASLIDLQQENYGVAQRRLEKLLELDRKYKFGDVSLVYAKVLYASKQTDAAIEHLQQHIKRWRHPEALYLLAQIHVERGQSEQARQHLLDLLLDINRSPEAIARKRGIWESRARKLLRELPY